jgi:hypothetical protein
MNKNFDLPYKTGYKDGSLSGYKLAKRDLLPLIETVKKTLDDNRHLCDGDICTLKDLRDAFNQLPHSIKGKNS